MPIIVLDISHFGINESVYHQNSLKMPTLRLNMVEVREIMKKGNESIISRKCKAKDETFKRL